MNDNELKNDTNTYRATMNLNTAIENPQINMNSAVDVNIKNVEANSSFSSPPVDSYSNFNESNQLPTNANYDMSQTVFPNNSYQNTSSTTDLTSSSNLNTKVNNEDVGNQFVPTMDYQNVGNYVPNNTNMGAVYEPTMEEKKRHRKGIAMSKELKIMLFIVFILFIFILLMPYIYDFFKKLQLVITSG